MSGVAGCYPFSGTVHIGQNSFRPSVADPGGPACTDAARAVQALVQRMFHGGIGWSISGDTLMIQLDADHALEYVRSP